MSRPLLVAREHGPRRGALGLEGLGAGLVLAIADWLASGLRSTPATLVVATLVAGLAVGLAAGIVGALSGKSGVATGLVLASGVALEGLALASKELEGPERSFAVCVILSLAAAALVLCRLRGRGPLAPARRKTIGLVAALPAGVLVAAAVSGEPWGRLVGLGAPFLWLAGEPFLAGSSGTAVAWLALVVPFLGAQLGERAESRRIEGPRPAADTGVERPSVVLLVLDTLRADAPAPHGALAAFARDGVDFRQCISAAPWTLPAVSSLLTGVYPSRHGAISAATPLGEGVTTLAERLREQGYATAGFTGGVFVSAGYHLDRGFERFDPASERRFPAFGGHLPLVWRLAKNRYFPLRWLVRWVDEYRGLAGELEAARAWAESEPHRPKFLFLHTYEVHDYYLYDPDLDDPVLDAHPSPSARFAGRLSVRPSELQGASAEDLAHFHALYAGRVAAVERLLPEVLHELTPLVGEDALWIVTADHGEGFDAARGRIHHGGRLHEDLLRVPLVLRAPGRLPRERVVDAQVRSVDVVPTVLDLLGIEPPADLAGESLLPALRGERGFPGSALSEEHAAGSDLLSLRRDGWKLVRSGSTELLYHLAEDPDEDRPVGGDPVPGLRAELARYAERSRPQPGAEVELDAATLEHMRALGY